MQKPSALFFFRHPSGTKHVKSVVLHKLLQTFCINNGKAVPSNLIAKSKLFKDTFFVSLWDRQEWTIREFFVLLEGKLISVSFN